MSSSDSSGSSSFFFESALGASVGAGAAARKTRKYDESLTFKVALFFLKNLAYQQLHQLVRQYLRRYLYS